MNEQQKEIIRKLAYNEPTLSALKELFNEVISTNNLLTEIDTNASNELVGQKAKVLKIASGMINECFEEIDKYKVEADNNDLKDNPGK